MGTLKEEAQAHEPKQTLNIADLDQVDISLPVEDRSGIDSDGKDFEYKVLVLDEKEYRTPGIVLEEIKKIIKLRPDVKFVNVSKTGSGLATKYEVELIEPITEPTY